MVGHMGWLKRSFVTVVVQENSWNIWINELAPLARPNVIDYKTPCSVCDNANVNSKHVAHEHGSGCPAP